MILTAKKAVCTKPNGLPDILYKGFGSTENCNGNSKVIFVGVALCIVV